MATPETLSKHQFIENLYVILSIMYQILTASIYIGIRQQMELYSTTLQKANIYIHAYHQPSNISI